MIEIKENEIKDISLKIKTIVIDSEEIEPDAEEVVSLLQRVFDGETVSEQEIDDVFGEESKTEIELCTVAEMYLNKEGSIEISYVENEDDEQ